MTTKSVDLVSHRTASRVIDKERKLHLIVDSVKGSPKSKKSGFNPFEYKTFLTNRREKQQEHSPAMQRLTSLNTNGLNRLA